MLNIFPIQWLDLFAYFILRIFTGMVYLYFAREIFLNWSKIKSAINPPRKLNKNITLFIIFSSELLIGILFFIGLFTQIAAIFSMLFCLKLMFWQRHLKYLSRATNLHLFLLFGISITLFITGAGAIAFDLPI